MQYLKTNAESIATTLSLSLSVSTPLKTLKNLSFLMSLGHIEKDQRCDEMGKRRLGYS